ncbi:hypothetical protein [Azospirillum sp.]|uniref:hypothetical protein n=1 Tax=Azospirillum sp. TaxID=34012 RepID=UPI003D75EAF0
MMVTAAYWLFLLLTAAGKVVAFAAWVVFAIALPLTRIQVAREQHAPDFGRVLTTNLAVAGCGVVGVFVLLENVRIFLTAM